MTISGTHLSRVTQEHLKTWWAAARPAFYIATLIPLLLGYSFAVLEYNVHRPALFALILLVSFLLHLGANLANDLFDYLAGTDTEDTIGGSRGIQSGAATVSTYKIVVVLIFAGAIFIGGAGALYTGYQGTWLIIFFATFSSFFYVAPPIRYGYHALGEIFVFLNMGILMTAGCTYALTGRISTHALAASIPVGLMVAGILYFQSIPEIESDKSAGKNTLANMLGPRWAIIVLRLWWPIIWGTMIVLWLTGICSWLVLFGIALSVPLYIKACIKTQEVKESGNWFALDPYGHLIRKMYLLCGASMLVAIWL